MPTGVYSIELTRSQCQGRLSFFVYDIYFDLLSNTFKKPFINPIFIETKVRSRLVEHSSTKDPFKWPF